MRTARMVEAVDLNLRHLRAFAEVCRQGSITDASGVVYLSQPAITQGLAKLEGQIGAKLFLRSGRGLAPTEDGKLLRFRTERAIGMLESGTVEAYRRARHPKPEAVTTKMTGGHLRALIAIDSNRSFSAAARTLGLAQPTVYRAARDLELVTELKLFEKSETGTVLSRAATLLSRAARLTLAEIDQGLQEISHRQGVGVSQMRIGALPLARSTVLPEVIERMATTAPALKVQIIDGPYSELTRALRQGDLDVIVGALRSADVALASDVDQETLFEDRLGIFCGPGHPLLGSEDVPFDLLKKYRWVLPPTGAPTRRYFEGAMPDVAEAAQNGLVETSSMVMVRGLLESGQRLTIISRNQVATEVRTGLMFELPVALQDAHRPIGYTKRQGWVPTSVQQSFIEMLSQVSDNWSL